MTTTKKKKSAREKRVLVASIICAGLIVAGSTFAWFTSQDEVTNRLSASANYGVSIAEDFQPPEDWVPGQTINKDVSAVNTGNVDAFVRTWLEGQMRVLNETEPSVDASTGTPTTELTEVTDADKTALGLTYYKSATTGEGDSAVTTYTYYRTLSTEKIDNANDAAHASATDEDTNQPATFSEVQAVQAGGVLVYAPANAAYHWTLEQATELPVYTAAADTTMTNLAKGTVVGNSTTTESSATKLAPASDSDSNYYGAIDASTFTPETTGLYIFRRNVAETADGTANTYEYSGYYYDKALNKYFALHTDTGANGKSDYVLPSGVVTENTAEPSKDQVLPVTVSANKVYLYTASEKVLETGTAATNLQWEYHAPDSSATDDLKKNGYFSVSYAGTDGILGDDTATLTTNESLDDIVINVALANIGDTSEAWTAITDTTAPSKTTFYYNNDVEEGDTTRKLVDSVALSDATTQKAYLAFDFDLNVHLESVQVTTDDKGAESYTSVTPWAATDTENVGATGADNGDRTVASEIEKIKWTNN